MTTVIFVNRKDIIREDRKQVAGSRLRIRDFFRDTSVLSSIDKVIFAGNVNGKPYKRRIR